MTAMTRPPSLLDSTACTGASVGGDGNMFAGIRSRRQTISPEWWSGGGWVGRKGGGVGSAGEDCGDGGISPFGGPGRREPGLHPLRPRCNHTLGRPTAAAPPISASGLSPTTQAPRNPGTSYPLRGEDEDPRDSAADAGLLGDDPVRHVPVDPVRRISRPADVRRRCPPPRAPSPRRRRSAARRRSADRAGCVPPRRRWSALDQVDGGGTQPVRSRIAFATSHRSVRPSASMESRPVDVGVGCPDLGQKTLPPGMERARPVEQGVVQVEE